MLKHCNSQRLCCYLELFGFSSLPPTGPGKFCVGVILPSLVFTLALLLFAVDVVEFALFFGLFAVSVVVFVVVVAIICLLLSVFLLL